MGVSGQSVSEDITAVAGAATAAVTAPVVVVEMAPPAFAATAGAAAPALAIEVAANAAATAAATAPVPQVALAGVAGDSTADGVSPGLSITVAPPAASATADFGNTQPSVNETIAAVAAAALAAAGVPALSLVVVANGAASAIMPVPLVSVTDGVAPPAAIANASATSPVVIVAVSPPAAVAIAAIGDTDGLVTIGDYLRAALRELEAERVVIQAELVVAAANNSEQAIDYFQNRASVCSIAIAEVERAIEFDDIRGPYVPAPEGASTAAAAAPVVAVV